MKNLFVFSMLAILVACQEVKTPDGTVSDEALEIARNLEGTYVGKFKGEPAKVIFTLEENAPKAKLVYTETGVEDILGKDCGSSIEALKSYRPKEKKGLLTAYFGLNDGTCSVKGKEVAFKFRKNGGLKVEILEDITVIYIPNPDVDWPVIENNRGDYQEIRHYIRGSFTKE